MELNVKLKKLIEELGMPKYASYNSKNFNQETDTVFYSGPFWDENELIAATSAILTGKWLASGENVAKFQWRFSKQFEVTNAHMVNSGSSANLVMVAALKKRFDWKDNSEIIVSPVGFPTTIAPIVQNKLKPVFIDIEMNTLNFDLNLIEQAITDKTVAIFVSPVLGNPPDLDVLLNIAKKHNILLIGDNCDSLGSKWNEMFITHYYHSWTTSFYPAHHITTGEGGMICSDDKELIDIARSVSWWGRDCRCIGSANLLSCGTCGNRFDKWLENYDGILDHKYLFTNMGYNLKPLDLQGAIGIEQLKKIKQIDTLRRENFNKIKNLFTSYVKEVRIADKLEKADPSWFGVPLICESKEVKDKLQSFLEANRIQTRNYFAGNILLHPGYNHLDDYHKYPNANLALSHVFFVGCPPHYDEKVFEYYKNILIKWNTNDQS